MPTTNRPFFANFLAAFRAHAALTKASSSTATSNVTTQSSTSSAFTSPTSQLNSAASARTITTKSSSTPGPSTTSTTAAVQAANNAFSHTRHSSTSPHVTPSSVGRQATGQSPTSPGRSGWARRRGSDSSSDSGGFREVLGGEKWYVGGRTATGEERFLRLGMVHRERSWERRSADQMSL